MRTKFAFFGLIVLFLLSFSLPEVTAQGKKKGPPPWAPANGYRAKTRQIYFPEHNFYFDIQKGVYIYLNGGNWEANVKLPSVYARVDLGRSVQVELKLDTDFPQQYNVEHLQKYGNRTGQGENKPTGWWKWKKKKGRD